MSRVDVESPGLQNDAIGDDKSPSFELEIKGKEMPENDKKDGTVKETPKGVCGKIIDALEATVEKDKTFDDAREKHVPNLWLIPIWLLAKIFFVFVLVYLTVTATLNDMERDYLSPAYTFSGSNNTMGYQNCSLIPSTFSGTYLLDSLGNWEGTTAFQGGKAKYLFTFNAFSHTYKQYKDIMVEMKAAINSVAAAAAYSPVHINLLHYMSYAYINVDGAVQHVLRFVADPAIVFNKQYKRAALLTRAVPCAAEPDLNYDTATGYITLSYDITSYAKNFNPTLKSKGCCKQGTVYTPIGNPSTSAVEISSTWGVAPQATYSAAPPPPGPSSTPSTPSPQYTVKFGVTPELDEIQTIGTNLLVKFSYKSDPKPSDKPNAVAAVLAKMQTLTQQNVNGGTSSLLFCTGADFSQCATVSSATAGLVQQLTLKLSGSFEAADMPNILTALASTLGISTSQILNSNNIKPTLVARRRLYSEISFTASIVVTSSTFINTQLNSGFYTTFAEKVKTLIPRLSSASVILSNAEDISPTLQPTPVPSPAPTPVPSAPTKPTTPKPTPSPTQQMQGGGPGPGPGPGPPTPTSRRKLAATLEYDALLTLSPLQGTSLSFTGESSSYLIDVSQITAADLANVGYSYTSFPLSVADQMAGFQSSKQFSLTGSSTSMGYPGQISNLMSSPPATYLSTCAIDPNNYGYNVNFDTANFAFKYNIRSVITAVAVNLGALPLSALQEMYTPFSMAAGCVLDYGLTLVNGVCQITFNGDTYVLHSYVDPKYDIMDPIFCLVRLTSAHASYTFTNLCLNRVGKAFVYPYFSHMGTTAGSFASDDEDFYDPSQQCSCAAETFDGNFLYPNAWATSKNGFSYTINNLNPSKTAQAGYCNVYDLMHGYIIVDSIRQEPSGGFGGSGGSVLDLDNTGSTSRADASLQFQLSRFLQMASGNTPATINKLAQIAGFSALRVSYGIQVFNDPATKTGWNELYNRILSDTGAGPMQFCQGYSYTRNIDPAKVMGTTFGVSSTTITLYSSTPGIVLANGMSITGTGITGTVTLSDCSSSLVSTDTGTGTCTMSSTQTIGSIANGAVTIVAPVTGTQSSPQSTSLTITVTAGSFSTGMSVSVTGANGLVTLASCTTLVSGSQVCTTTSSLNQVQANAVITGYYVAITGTYKAVFTAGTGGVPSTTLTVASKTSGLIADGMSIYGVKVSSPTPPAPSSTIHYGGGLMIDGCSISGNTGTCTLKLKLPPSTSVTGTGPIVTFYAGTAVLDDSTLIVGGVSGSGTLSNFMTIKSGQQIQGIISGCNINSGSGTCTLSSPQHIDYATVTASTVSQSFTVSLTVASGTVKTGMVLLVSGKFLTLTCPTSLATVGQTPTTTGTCTMSDAMTITASTTRYTVYTTLTGQLIANVKAGTMDMPSTTLSVSTTSSSASLVDGMTITSSYLGAEVSVTNCHMTAGAGTCTMLTSIPTGVTFIGTPVDLAGDAYRTPTCAIYAMNTFDKNLASVNNLGLNLINSHCDDEFSMPNSSWSSNVTYRYSRTAVPDSRNELTLGNGTFNNPPQPLTQSYYICRNSRLTSLQIAFGSSAGTAGIASALLVTIMITIVTAGWFKPRKGEEKKKRSGGISQGAVMMVGAVGVGMGLESSKG